MIILVEFISALIISISELLFWKNVSTKKLKLSFNKFVIAVFALTMFNIINYHFTSIFFKGIGIVLIATLISKIILKKTIRESIITIFICEIIVILLEAIYVMLASLLIPVESINNNIYVTFIADIFVGVVLYLVSNFNCVKRLNTFFYDITKQIKTYQIVLFLIIVTLSSSLIFANVYLNNNIVLIIIISMLMSVLYTIILIIIFNYQNRYYRVNIKYENSINNLYAQESIIEDFKIMNHENKNQLLTIKSMNKNKKIEGYINSLIEQKEKFKNEILDASLKLPEGGIRGLIYIKLLYMKEKNISCNLNVDKKINIKTFRNINDNDTVDVCQILGVYIDNAIEEVVNLNNRNININLYMEDNELVVSISNTYCSKLQVNNRTNELYTTKGKNHGYGLKLVRRLILNNKKLRNETQILKDSFNQKLFIKII